MQTNRFVSRSLAGAFLVLFVSVSVFAQTPTLPKMGLILDDEGYMQSPRKATLLSKSILPPAFTIRELLPPVGQQGAYNNCVGWVGSVATTIMEAKRNGFENNPAQIATVRYSPGWLYAQVKESYDVECLKGTKLHKVLEVMKTQGGVLMRCAPQPCGNDYVNCDPTTSRIEGYATLFDTTLIKLPKDTAVVKTRISAIKSALDESHNAVLIGMLIPRSFWLAARNTWQAAPGENQKNHIGRHAMAIVGFDDTINGGSFLIMNSWGTQWGNKGFTWAKYTDVIRFTKYAYQIYERVAPQVPQENINLKGSMEFRQGTALMPVSSLLSKGTIVSADISGKEAEMVTYTMSNTYKSNTSFKLNLTIDKQSYVYIVASDQQNRVNALFPYKGDTPISPIIPANNEMILPSPTASFTFDNVPGEDYFLVLISQYALNVEDITKRIKNAQGTIIQKAYATLGQEFISPANIRYQSNEVAYEVIGNPPGSIVPLLVKIPHI